MTKLIAIVSFLLLFLLSGFSQVNINDDYRISSHDVQFLRYFKDIQGVTKINDITQGPNGFIWMTGNKGLVRYNGYAFKWYNLKNTPELKSELFYHTKSNDKSGPYFSSTSGIYTVNSGQIEPVEKLQSMNLVTSMEIDAEGGLWLINSEKLYHYSDGKLNAGPKTHDKIKSLLKLPNGEIWVSGKTEFYKIYPESTEKLVLENPIYSIPIGGGVKPNGKKFFVFSKDISLVETEGKLIEDVQDSIFSKGLIKDLVVDKNGQYWFTGFGLSKTNLLSQDYYELSKTKRKNLTLKMFIDKDQTKWVIGEQGVWVFKDLPAKKIHLRGLPSGLEFELITTSLLVTETDEILVGTNGQGIRKIENKLITQIQGGTLLGDVVYALFKDRENYISCTSGGTMRFSYDGNEITVLDTLMPLVSYTYFKEADNKEYFSSWHPVEGFRVLIKTDGEYSEVPVLDGLRVFEIFRTSKNTLIFTTNKGAFEKSGEEILSLNEKYNLPQDHYYSVYENKKTGVLFLGTGGSGLIRIENNEVSYFNTRNGLPTNTISSLTADTNNDFWIAGIQVLYQIKDDSIRDRLARGDTSFHYKAYNLINPVSTLGSPNALLKDRVLYINNRSGVSIIPIDENSKSFVNVFVESVQTSDSVFINPTQLVVEASNDFLQFEIGALCLEESEFVKFKYRMTGYDENWLELGNNTSVNYSHLPDGEFEFELKAQFTDGEEITATPLKITKKSPWYMSYFMWLVYVGIGALLVNRFIYYRTQSVIRKNEKLQDEVDSQTLALQTNLQRTEELVAKRTAELQEANIHLQEGEERFRKLFEDTTSGLVLVDDSGKMDLFNKMALSIFGYDAQEFTKLKIEDLVPKRARGGHEDNRKGYHKKRDKRNMGGDVDLTALRKDGSEIPVQIGLSPLEIKGKKYTLAVIVNMTDRVEAERKIKESRERLSRAMEISKDGIWDWDLSTGEVKFSRALYTMLGYEPYEFPAGAGEIPKRVHPNDQNLPGLAFIQDANKMPEEGVEFEFRLETKSKNYIWVRLKAKMFNKFTDDLANRIVGVLTDITSEKQKKQEIFDAVISTENLERTRIAKDIHDGLQQTLTVSYMNLTQFKKALGEIDGEVEEKYQLSLDYLQKSINESRQVAHSLMPKDIESHGLRTTLEELINSLDEGAEHLNFQFNSNMQEEQIESDQIKVTLYRITQESLNNVMKYAKASLVTVQLNIFENVLTLMIEDNGIGFDVKEKVARNTGLGLNSMKNRVEAIGGFIEITSQPMRGTSVFVEVAL